MIGPASWTREKGAALGLTCEVVSPEDINAGETKVDHRPDVLVWSSHMKRRESTKMGARELVCCLQPVLLSNGDGFIDAVSCHAGQATLLNQTVGFPVALSPYAPHPSTRPKDLMFSWHIGDRRTLCLEVRRRLPEWYLTCGLDQEGCLPFLSLKSNICLAFEQDA